MAGKFELYKDQAGEYRFRLKAGNGETILASEGYKRRASATNAIASVAKNAQIGARFERKETKSGKHIFNLRARNGQVIGTSEHYESASGRENGIASVCKNAPSAKLVDLAKVDERLPQRTIRTVEKIVVRRHDVLERLAKR